MSGTDILHIISGPTDINDSVKSFDFIKNSIYNYGKTQQKSCFLFLKTKGRVGR